MKKKKTINVVGARPNFMKIAPIWNEMRKWPDYFEPIILHTGQHYDLNMSDLFFRDLELSPPDIFLGVGSGSQAKQTADIMIKFEDVCSQIRPDMVLVVGDVNSTLACSLVAAKLHIPVAHVEAGLRSYDMTMPEEINRKITDALSDMLFTTCEDANVNLKKEGISEERIHFVGNVMIDTLLKFKDKAKATAKIAKMINKGGYGLLTLHRPINVDNEKTFRNILEALQEISKKLPIIFPVHPRTQKQIRSFGCGEHFNFIPLDQIEPSKFTKSINLIDPLSYLEFLGLMANAKLVLTDSGGIQEESTILGVPCLTLRENTERPITVSEGTNTIVGTKREEIVAAFLSILDGRGKTGKIPKYWDGMAAERTVKILMDQR